MNETVSEPATFLKKEVRRIVFSEISKKDVPELYNTLKFLFISRRKCKLWVCIGRRTDRVFNNEKEFNQFMWGFLTGMLLIDDDFLDQFGDACPGHPRISN